MTYSTLEEALDARTSGQRRKATQRLDHLYRSVGSDQQACINIWAECRLPTHAWGELIDTLVATPIQRAAIRTSLRQVMRNWTLRGPQVRSASTLGHAVSQEALARRFEADGYGSAAMAHSEIRFMRSVPLSVVRRYWSDRKLARYVMWSTFDSSGNAPFETAPATADGIRGVLGLSKEDRHSPLLLLEYALPANLTARFPTIADAYAGDDWIYYFRPATPTEAKHGQTLPWVEYSDQGGRPETVHPPVKGKDLTAPIRLQR